MWGTITYDDNLSGFKICSDIDRHCQYFFFEVGKFLIRDFDPSPSDLSVSYKKYLESKYGTIKTDGGFIEEFYQIGEGGLMGVRYCLTNSNLDERNWVINIDGYAIDESDGFTDSDFKGYFLAIKIEGDL